MTNFRDGLSITALALVLCFPALSDPTRHLDLDTLRAKAGRGDAAAQSELGFMYYRGQGVPRDFAKARNCFVRPQKREMGQGN